MLNYKSKILQVAETQRNLLNIKLLPKRAAKNLKATLDYLYSQLRNHPVSHDDHVEEDLEKEFQKRKKEVNFLFCFIISL